MTFIENMLGHTPMQGSSAVWMNTVEVADWFRGRAVGVDLDVDAPESTWAPAAYQSFALVPIDGDIDWQSPKKVTPDHDMVEDHLATYGWWDLDDVPLGGAVFRVSSRRTIHLFIRVNEESWSYTKYEQPPRKRERVIEAGGGPRK